MALFDASVQAGVKHIVQVSALGADAHAASAYHRSKKAADDHLRSLPISSTIVQPSLVYGPGGASASLFERFAAMTVIPIVAIACWLPVVGIQIRLRNIAREAASEHAALPPTYWFWFRIWVALGVPAFFALVAIFYLMVFKSAAIA